jgi:pimeloyl-ACP methyl ester carboxylesterase
MINNIVLVHGAFADGSSWNKVIRLLQARDYNATAVQQPLTSLEEDVAITRHILSMQQGPTILVGHSYGGVIITVAGNEPNVSGLVYIAAFAPDEGESIKDLKSKAAPAAGAAHVQPDS